MMIQPAPSFRDNLGQLPAIDGIQRIDLVDAGGSVVASIENQPGEQATKKGRSGVPLRP